MKKRLMVMFLMAMVMAVSPVFGVTRDVPESGFVTIMSYDFEDNKMPDNFELVTKGGDAFSILDGKLQKADGKKAELNIYRRDGLWQNHNLHDFEVEAQIIIRETYDSNQNHSANIFAVNPIDSTKRIEFAIRKDQVLLLYDGKQIESMTYNRVPELSEYLGEDNKLKLGTSYDIRCSFIGNNAKLYLKDAAATDYVEVFNVTDERINVADADGLKKLGLTFNWLANIEVDDLTVYEKDEPSGDSKMGYVQIIDDNFDDGVLPSNYVTSTFKVMMDDEQNGWLMRPDTTRDKVVFRRADGSELILKDFIMEVRAKATKDFGLESQYVRIGLFENTVGSQESSPFSVRLKPYQMIYNDNDETATSIYFPSIPGLGNIQEDKPFNLRLEVRGNIAIVSMKPYGGNEYIEIKRDAAIDNAVRGIPGIYTQWRGNMQFDYIKIYELPELEVDFISSVNTEAVSIEGDLTISFNNKINATTISKDTILLKQGDQIVSDYSVTAISETKAKITFSGLDYETNYNIFITDEVKDKYGRGIKETSNYLTFTTTKKPGIGITTEFYNSETNEKITNSKVIIGTIKAVHTLNVNSEIDHATVIMALYSDDGQQLIDVDIVELDQLNSVKNSLIDVTDLSQKIKVFYFETINTLKPLDQYKELDKHI